MEFTPRKTSPKSIAHEIRHNPYASGGKSRKYFNRYKTNSRSDACLQATPPRSLTKNAESKIFKPRCLSRASQMLNKSQENTTKILSENIFSTNLNKTLSTKRIYNAMPNINSSEFYGSKDEDDDDIFLSSITSTKENNNCISKTFPKVYGNKYARNSVIVSDIQPSKIERNYGTKCISVFDKLDAAEDKSRNEEEKENIPVESTKVAKQSSPHLIGFPNYGNTCYLNAVLQSLVGLPSFTVDCARAMAKINIPPTTITHSLWNVILNRERKNISEIKDSLRKIKENLEKIDNSFTGFKMQDANEFLTQILDTVKDEIDNAHVTTPPSERQVMDLEITPPDSDSGIQSINNSRSLINKNSSIFDTPGSTSPVVVKFKLGSQSESSLSSDDEIFVRCKTVSKRCRKRHRNSKIDLGEYNVSKALTTPIKCNVNGNQTSSDTLLKNPVKENFEFQLLESYKCLGCSEVVHRKQDHFALYVNLPENMEEGIQNAVEEYMKEDQRDISCEKCKCSKASVITSITKLPRVLIVQLKRYEYRPDSGMSIKVSSKVGVNLWLNLDDFVSYTTEEPPVWHPNLIGSYLNRDEMCSKLTVRNLSSQLNRCEYGNNSLSSENKSSFGMSSVASSLPTNSANVQDPNRQRSVMEVNGSDKGSEEPGVVVPSCEVINEDEDEEIQKAIKLSLQEMGLCYGQQDNPQCSSGVASPSSADDSMDGTHMYRLISVISHFGLTTRTGHYVSDVFESSSNSWFHYDDECVCALPERVVEADGRQRNGYIFFYVHRDLFRQLQKW